MNTPPPTNGDRIRLIGMGDDPEPIQIGETGTVVDVARYGAGKSAWFQWDNGRTLMLVSPPDPFELVAT